MCSICDIEVMNVDTSVSKHTPGPWQFYADVPSTDPNWHIVTNASRMRVLANVHIEPGNEVDLANARLITFAPELLASLEAVLPLVKHTDDAGWDVMKKARDIVEKANGR